jgi:hypothetical protein
VSPTVSCPPASVDALWASSLLPRPEWVGKDKTRSRGVPSITEVDPQSPNHPHPSPTLSGDELQYWSIQGQPLPILSLNDALFDLHTFHLRRVWFKHADIYTIAIERLKSISWPWMVQCGPLPVHDRPICFFSLYMPVRSCHGIECKDNLWPGSQILRANSYRRVYCSSLERVLL